MKFNAIVGNPPYQESKGTDKTKVNGAFASAIYPLFIDVAIKNIIFLHMQLPFLSLAALQG